MKGVLASLAMGSIEMILVEVVPVSASVSRDVIKLSVVEVVESLLVETVAVTVVEVNMEEC